MQKRQAWPGLRNWIDKMASRTMSGMLTANCMHAEVGILALFMQMYLTLSKYMRQDVQEAYK